MPSTRDDSPPYLPLSANEEEPQPAEKSSAPPNDSIALYRTGVLWLCISCTIVNILTLMLSSWQQTDTYAPFDKRDVHSLRRPSQYIGFDTIPRPSPVVARNFTNFPFAVTQIDAQEPFKVFKIDNKRFMSLSGTVYPDDKKIVVTNEISTILQFRAIDYGMEICELHIDLPQSSAAAERVEAISVYRLESSSPLDVRSLSYRTRPRRLGRLGDVHAAINAEVDWHRKMTCKLEEVLTLELACPEDIPVGTQCSLEWWQRKEESIPGVYIVQRSTI